MLVAGGGPAGMETASELGETYGGKKKITILSGSRQLLPRLKNPNIGKDAENRLARMGVKAIHDSVKVVSVTSQGSQTLLTLSDGTEMTVDVYIDATGDKPNNEFVPESWLNEKGYAKTNPQTLRLDVPGGRNVYCFGSVGSYSNGSMMDT
jgi:pyruvate/2-oxoglutarate dehydrogenase complex dihydrolipoamide dehydrogenase (E3) component